MSEAFKWDVAISLRGQDAELAERLKAALEPSLRVFVFTQRQQEIAGRDLVETFSEVFKRDARLAVILHRAGWGDTEYTDLEALAIQSRGLKTRWRSPVLIALDDTQVPIWFPDVYGYLDFARYGFDEAVGVIRARAEELGWMHRPESGAERAARHLASLKAARARQERMESDIAGGEVESETGWLFGHIDAQVELLKERASELGAQSGGHRPPGPSEPTLGVRTTHYSTNVIWRQRYTNSIRGAHLIVTHAPQRWPIPGTPGMFYPYDEREIRTEYYTAVLTSNGWEWQVMHRRPQPDGDTAIRLTDAPILSSTTLADHIMALHLDGHFAKLGGPLPRHV